MINSDRWYLAYLLRLWRVKQNGNYGWRASLENPHTGELRGFASLELLRDFLCEQIKNKEKIQDDNKQ